MADKKTAPALRLTLGGAPDTPHRIEGLPGLYRPGRPTPVGGPGEATEEQARELDKQAGAPVELVRVAETEVAALREAHDADLREARNGQRDAIKAQPEGAEAEQVNDELAATSIKGGQ